MTSEHSFVFSVTHTYYRSAEWVNDYHEQQPTLYCSDDEAIGFYNGLSAPSWQGRFIFGDDNGLAQEIHWKEATDSNYIDNTHFAYFAGHGASDRIVFYHPSDEDKRSLYYNEAHWGNGQVDWIALAACNVLNQSSYQNWKPAFSGLHSIVSWDTQGAGHQDFGQRFSYYMKTEKRTVWESWQLAADYCITIPDRFNVAILAVDIDGNQYTRECIDDHIYGMGKAWFSPQGNPAPSEFVYDLHECS